jgi:hypothetical protein
MGWRFDALFMCVHGRAVPARRQSAKEEEILAQNEMPQRYEADWDTNANYVEERFRAELSQKQWASSLGERDALNVRWAPTGSSGVAGVAKR